MMLHDVTKIMLTLRNVCLFSASSLAYLKKIKDNWVQNNNDD